MEQFDHPTLGSVTINESTRARRISISIRSSGDLRLTIPKGGDRGLALRFLESRVEQIIAVRARHNHSGTQRVQPRPLSPTERQRLADRTVELARAHGFRYERLTLRSMQTKWGSCSYLSTRGNNISLNTALIELPSHLIDFVILHELTHTIHHNHSAAFHDALNRLLRGRERELDRELKLYRLG